MTAAPPPAAYATRRSRSGSSSTRRDTLIRSVWATKGVLSYVAAKSVPGYRSPPPPGCRGAARTAPRPVLRKTLTGEPEVHDKPSPVRATSTAGPLALAGLPVGPFATVPNLVTVTRTVLAVLIGAIAVAAGDLGSWRWRTPCSGSATSPTAGRPGDSARRPGPAPSSTSCATGHAPACCAWASWRRSRSLPVVVVFVLSFMVLDSMLSLAFLCWPVVSPNYFHMVDRRVWQLNWSPVAKAANTAGVVGALALELYAVAFVVAVGVLASRSGPPAASSSCLPPRDGELARGGGARDLRRPRLRAVSAGQRRGLRRSSPPRGPTSR